MSFFQSSSPVQKAILLVSLFTLQSSILTAATFYQDEFTGASISPVWTTSAGAPVVLDDPNNQLDYTHTANTSRRYLNYNSGFIQKTAYLKGTISNFTGASSIWFGFVGSNPGNNTNYAQTIITGNGIYELFFNNTNSAQNFDNNAGWTGSLPAGSGLWSTDGGATSAALTIGGNIGPDSNVFGFGFANFGNSAVFPSSSFSLDSIFVSDTLIVSAPANTAPTVSISAPANNTSVAPGTNVTLTALATDIEDGDLSTSIVWNSNLDGSLGTGASMSTTSLSLGTHTITASATDTGSLVGQDSISLTVGTPNTPPVVQITSPADDSSALSGSVLTLTGTASDTEDGNLNSTITWFSNINGELGTGTPLDVSHLSLGTHTLSARITDSASSTVFTSIDVTITSAINAGASRPNVIVIICDDAGYADFSFMDGISGETSQVPTPHLAALASRGVTFSKAYVAANCQPTRAALVTGAYQQRTGNESVGNNHFLRSQIFEGVPTANETIWDRLKALDYTTGAIGKWHLGSIENNPASSSIPEMLGNRPENQGIDEFYGFWHGSRNFTVGTYNRNGTLDPSHSLQPRFVREALIHPDGSKSDTIVEFSKYADVPAAPKYLTTIFGDYAEQFVADHHDDEDPFFLYVAHPAPHKPWTNESPDYNDPRITSLTPNNRRQVASMMITMDREIGELMDKLDDPNGDGNNSDSITDNTLVIFINDNGGVSGMEDGINGTDNGKLKGFKGSSFDGGIRVPMILAGAGLDPAKKGTIYHRPVHGIDILPTAIALAGGNLDSDDQVDGTNILPFVNGTSSGDPHEVLVHKWRGSFAVIKGDYKLQNSRNVSAAPEFYGLFRSTNGATDIDPGENNDLIGDPANAVLVEEMKRDLTDHESFFDKPRFAILANTPETEPINIFDHHVFRPGVFTDWSGNADVNVDPVTGTRNWYEAGTTTEKFLFNTDSFAGAILEFPVHGSSYTANNDYRRKTGMEYMLNKMILSGDTGSGGTSTISGLPLIFTNSLEKAPANLALDASGSYTFDLTLDLILYHDLHVTGDGTATYNLNGSISQHFEKRGIVKTGTSTATINGARTYTGDTTVDDGVLTIAQINANDDDSSIAIAAGASLNLTFTGTDIIGNLIINGVPQAAGVYKAPGNPAAGTELPQLSGTGTLTVTPSGYTAWSDTNAPGAPFDGDHDNDLVPNAIEYFLGESGSSFTNLPSLQNGSVTWPISPSYTGTYGTHFLVETSPNLTAWNPADLADLTLTPGVSLQYTYPTTDLAHFIRLSLTAE